MYKSWISLKIWISKDNRVPDILDRGKNLPGRLENKFGIFGDIFTVLVRI